MLNFEEEKSHGLNLRVFSTSTPTTTISADNIRVEPMNKISLLFSNGFSAVLQITAENQYIGQNGDVKKPLLLNFFSRRSERKLLATQPKNEKITKYHNRSSKNCISYPPQFYATNRTQNSVPEKLP